MSYQEPPRAVFDCMIYLQATANDEGVSAKVLRLLDKKAITLFISEQILDEVNDVLSRSYIREKIPQITDQRVNALLIRLNQLAVKIVNVPDEFKYERDPKDEKYINLALVTKAEYIITFDTDLLDLMNESKEAGKVFRQKYPFLKILNPMEFLTLIEKSNGV
jgi:putative PIN family toxin of toxin-antitoxin system